MPVPKVCNPWIVQGTTKYLVGQAVFGSVRETPVTKIPVGKAPFPKDSPWGRALPAWVPKAPAWAGKLAKDLELVLSSPRGPLLTPREVWNNLEDRGVVLRALSASSEVEAREILADWLQYEKKLVYQGLALRAPAIGPVTAFLLNYERPVRRVLRSSGPLLTEFTLPESSRRAIQRALKNPTLWPRTVELLKDVGQEIYLRGLKIQRFLDEARPFAAKLWGPQQAQRLTVLDVYLHLLPQLQGKEREALSLIIKKYWFISWDEPEKLLREDLRRAVERDAKDQIEALSKLLEWFKKVYGVVLSVRRFTRAMALAVPRFLAENVVSDSIFKPLVVGLHKVPYQALNEMRAYYGAWRIYLDYQWSPEALREAGVVPKTGLQLMLERNGISRLPAEISASFERGLTHQELQASTWRGASIWGLPLVGKLRDIPEPLQKVSPLHWLARWESFIMLLARSQESATRLAVFGDRYLTLWEREGLPAIEGLLRDLFELHDLPAQEASRLMEDFRNMPERTPEALRELIRTRFPGFEILAGQAEQAAREVVREIRDSALEITRQVNYDYLARTNADEVLTHLFKFHFWASRNLPFYLEEFAKHHVLFRSWVRYWANQQRAAEEEGWPARLDQMAPVLDLALFGQNWTLYLAFWAVISVTTQADPPSLGGMGTPWERLTRVTAGAGFSPHWDIQMLMALLGYDTRDLPPVFPLSRSLQRAAGINPNPMARLLGELREVVSGRLPGSEMVASESVTGSMATDRLVWRELVLMSYERTGRPNHLRYLAAMVNPEDPLFQEALRRVMARQGFSELSYLFSPVRFQAESKTEEELRRQMAQHPAESIEDWRAGVERGDPARWTSFVPSDIREAQIQAGFAMEQVLALQGQRLNPEWAVKHVPWYVRYRLWAREQPPGKRSVGLFLETVR